MMASRNKYHLTESDRDDLKQWFFGYVRSFSTSNPTVKKAIVLKKKHSLRVCHEIKNIGMQLGLSHDNLRLAETMALFHDVGRFEQFVRYQTFVDRKSEDHGALAVKVLRKERALAALDAETQELILKAISYHNLFNIPEDEDPVCIYFSKLLRDADKLDIFTLVSAYYHVARAEKSAAVELDLPDTPTVSEEILTSLRDGKMTGKHQLQSLNDLKLLQMGWVYDINYQPTFQMIQERDYLRKIRDTLPVSQKIDQVYYRLLCHLRKCSEFGNLGFSPG